MYLPCFVDGMFLAKGNQYFAAKLEQTLMKFDQPTLHVQATYMISREGKKVH